MHFLLIDDDPALLLALAEALRLRFDDAEITTNSSAENALDFLATHHVDLVISDMLMSGMDGCRFASALAKLTTHPPVILITGAVTEDPIPIAASIVVRKPFSMREIETAIQEVLPRCSEP